MVGCNFWPHRALLHQGGGRRHGAAGGVDRQLEGLAGEVPGEPRDRESVVKAGWNKDLSWVVSTPDQ